MKSIIRVSLTFLIFERRLLKSLIYLNLSMIKTWRKNILDAKAILFIPKKLHKNPDNLLPIFLLAISIFRDTFHRWLHIIYILNLTFQV